MRNWKFNSHAKFYFWFSLLRLLACCPWECVFKLNEKIARSRLVCWYIRECRVKSFFNQLFNPINIIERELLSSLYFSAYFCARTARLSKQTRARVHSHAAVGKFHSHNFFYERENPKGKKKLSRNFVFHFSISLAAKNQEQQAITPSNESIFSPLVVLFRGELENWWVNQSQSRERVELDNSRCGKSALALCCWARGKRALSSSTVDLLCLFKWWTERKWRDLKSQLRKIEFLKKKLIN